MKEVTAKDILGSRSARESALREYEKHQQNPDAQILIPGIPGVGKSFSLAPEMLLYGAIQILAKQ